MPRNESCGDFMSAGPAVQEAEQSAEELMTQQQALQAELARIKEQLDGSERRLSEAAAELESLKAARTEEQQQQQPNGQAHANGVHTAHGPDGREEVATELAELQEEMMGLQAENAMLLGKVQVADKRVAAATAVQVGFEKLCLLISYGVKTMGMCFPEPEVSC